MKQKTVIKVYLKDDKSRSKALEVVVSAQGIDSVGWTGPNQDQIELEGDDVDIIKVTKSLRKKVGRAELVSVSPVKPDSESPPEPDPAGSGSDCTFYPIGGGGGYRFRQPPMYVAISDYSDQYSKPPGCSIM